MTHLSKWFGTTSHFIKKNASAVICLKVQYFYIVRQISQVHCLPLGAIEESLAGFMDSCLKCMLHKWLLSVTKSYLNYPNYSPGKSWQVMEAFLVLMMRRTYCGMEKVNMVCCFFHIECNFISVASDGLYRNQWTIFIAVLWQLSREIFKEIQLLTKKQEQIAGWKDTICLGVRMGKSAK